MRNWLRETFRLYLRYMIAAFVVGVLAATTWLIAQNSHHVSKCHIVHAHQGCPAGSTVLKNFFSERDGTKIDACMKPTGEDCVDELRPGESMSVRLNQMK